MTDAGVNLEGQVLLVAKASQELLVTQVCLGLMVFLVLTVSWVSLVKQDTPG